MKSSDEYVSTLSELGLSVAQAKVYLALAKSNSLKAQETSSICGVARPEVYRVLAQLEEAGLVERIISKPNEFRAIPIEKCVSNLIQRRILKTAELQQKTLTLIQDFKLNNASEKLDEKIQFMLITNRDAVWDKSEKLVRSIQETACLLGPRIRLTNWISNYSAVIEEALTRKVYFRFVLPEPERNQQLDGPVEALMKHPNFELRAISEFPNLSFSIWDRKEMMLSTSGIDTPFSHPTLSSNSSSIIDLSQNYFDLMWQKARNLRKEE